MADVVLYELLQEKATAAHWKAEAEKLREENKRLVDLVAGAGKSFIWLMNTYNGTHWEDWEDKLDDTNDSGGTYRLIFKVLRAAGLLPKGEEAKG